MAIKDIFLVAKYTGIPKDPNKTHLPGYITNPENISYEEQVYVIRGLPKKYLQHQVILNLTQEKIIKNSFNSGRSFEEILGHFVEGYSDYINDSINQLNANIGISTEV